jgi:hypothetical protein
MNFRFSPFVAARAALVVFSIALCAIAACNPEASEAKRGRIHGTVTLNGKPVSKGTIRFMAVDPNAVNVLADIANGQYSTPEGQGPTKGKYQVQINVPSETKRRVPNDDAPGQFMEEAVETLPTRYHRDSTTMLDYDPDDAEPHDYHLTTP